MYTPAGVTNMALHQLQALPIWNSFFLIFNYFIVKQLLKVSVVSFLSYLLIYTKCDMLLDTSVFSSLLTFTLITPTLLKSWTFFHVPVPPQRPGARTRASTTEDLFFAMFPAPNFINNKPPTLHLHNNRTH